MASPLAFPMLILSPTSNGFGINMYTHAKKLTKVFCNAKPRISEIAPREIAAIYQLIKLAEIAMNVISTIMNNLRSLFRLLAHRRIADVSNNDTV